MKLDRNNVLKNLRELEITNDQAIKKAKASIKLPIN